LGRVKSQPTLVFRHKPVCKKKQIGCKYAVRRTSVGCRRALPANYN
jgi:hypothetical protein